MCADVGKGAFLQRSALAVLVTTAIVPPVAGNALLLLAPDAGAGPALLMLLGLVLAISARWAAGALADAGALTVPPSTVRLAGALRVAVAAVGVLALAAPSLRAAQGVAFVVADIVFWSTVLLGARAAGGGVPAAAAVVYTVARGSAAALMLLDVRAPREPFLLMHRFGSVLAAGLIALSLVRAMRRGAVDTPAGPQKDAPTEVP
jgi:hypothetical protein